MTDIIRNIETIITDMEESGGYLVCLDQEKAFDRVNHKYLFEILNHIGVNGTFMNITKAMYTDITSQILVNGTLTDKIEIQRSIRQGCAFSMLLFVIISIPLIHMINNNGKIKGYTTKRNKNLKIQSYADDNTIITHNINDFDEVLKEYDKHARATEAKINEHKTEILKIGNARNIPEKHKNLEKDSVKILGTHFMKTMEESRTKKITEVTKKIQQITNKRKHYRTDVIGRTIMANSLIISKLNHMMWILEKNNMIDLKKTISKYITGYKNNYKELTGPKEKGGMGLIDFDKRITATKTSTCKVQIFHFDKND